LALVEPQERQRAMAVKAVTALFLPARNRSSVMAAGGAVVDRWDFHLLAVAALDLPGLAEMQLTPPEQTEQAEQPARMAE